MAVFNSSFFTKPLYSLISVSLILLPAQSKPYSQNDCYADVVAKLGSGLLLANDTIFYRDGNGHPMSTIVNPVLTLDGCNEICGSDPGWYSDIGPRLSTWIIPVFLLLSNMEVSPLDKRRYLMLIHLVGDPIDSLWSLSLKMEAWSRCRTLAETATNSKGTRQDRNLATIIGAMEEIVGFDINPLTLYTKIVTKTQLSVEQMDIVLSRTAQEIADNRTDERLRTFLATVLYIYQLVSAFVAIIGGGNTTPPGGRIAAAMFMTWVIPAILLSNAVGGFPSCRFSYTILERFAHYVNPDVDLWSHLRQISPQFQQYRSIDEHFNSLSWSGAVYTYRPNKQIPFSSGSKDQSTYVFLALSMSPIIISCCIASFILYNTPPTAINCRSFVMFGITFGWLISAFVTWSLPHLKIKSRVLWYIIIFKDIFIAIPTVLLIFLATSGRFNSCRCWSGVFSLQDNARVLLNPTPEFLYNDRTIYPALVSGCIMLQLLVFAAMMWTGWKGWGIMRWGEKEKEQEWRLSRLRL